MSSAVLWASPGSAVVISGGVDMVAAAQARKAPVWGHTRQVRQLKPINSHLHPEEVLPGQQRIGPLLQNTERLRATPRALGARG